MNGPSIDFFYWTGCFWYGLPAQKVSSTLVAFKCPKRLLCCKLRNMSPHFASLFIFFQLLFTIPHNQNFETFFIDKVGVAHIHNLSQSTEWVNYRCSNGIYCGHSKTLVYPVCRFVFYNIFKYQWKFAGFECESLRYNSSNWISEEFGWKSRTEILVLTVIVFQQQTCKHFPFFFHACYYF